MVVGKTPRIARRSMMRVRDRQLFDIGLLGVGALAAGLFFVALLLDIPNLQLLTKAIPVLVLAVWLRPWQGRESRPIVAGLLLSAIGDLCLQLSPSLFVVGLTAFLLAHVAYIAAFLRRSRQLAAPYLWLSPSLGAMMWPVLAYIIVICTMLWRAWAQVGDGSVSRATAWTAALGASSFAISDTLVAYNRFIEPVLGLQILLMLLYWAGQWGIAASTQRRAT
jgi:uncharacterized membrane protein YhhN